MNEQLLAITSSHSFQLELWRDFNSFTANSSPNPENSISFATVKHQEKKGRKSECEKEISIFSIGSRPKWHWNPSSATSLKEWSYIRLNRSPGVVKLQYLVLLKTLWYCHLSRSVTFLSSVTHLQTKEPNKQAAKTNPIPDFLAVFCTPPAPGLPGEPVFLLKRLLKKLAKTPSLAALSKEETNTDHTEHVELVNYNLFSHTYKSLANQWNKPQLWESLFSLNIPVLCLLGLGRDDWMHIPAFLEWWGA